MSNNSSKPVLGYFKLRGWAGPIRLLLAYLGVEHDEKLYPVPTLQDGMGQWTLDKSKLGLSFPNMPYWIDSMVKLTETKAILKHIARLNNPTLLGVDLVQKALLNMLEDVLWDMWMAFTKMAMEHTDDSSYLLWEMNYNFNTTQGITLNKSYQSIIINSKEGTKRDFFVEALDKAKKLEECIGDSEWAGGHYITYVDFLLYEVLHHYSKFYDGKLLKGFPRLRGYMTRFQNIPSIAKCLSSENFVSTPSFSYKFKAKL